MHRPWRIALLTILASWMPLSALAGDEDPRMLEMPPPRYPPAAARDAIGGTAVLLITISATGDIEAIELETSSNHPALDAAAIEAAQRWKFSPALQDGEPVVGRVRIPVDFSLGNEPRYQPILARMAPQDRVAPVPADMHRRVPGYIDDPQPIDAGTVAELVAMLEQRGRLQEMPMNLQWPKVYVVAEGADYSEWTVHGRPDQLAAVVRRRLVSDGEHGFFVTRMLCEAPKPDACSGLQSALRQGRPQAASVLPGKDDAASVAGDDAPVQAR